MAHDPGTQNVPYAIWSNYSPPPSGAAIYSISGNLTDGSVITIKGKGFGQGASNFMFENFQNFTLAGQLLTDIENGFDTPSIYADSVADSRSGTYSVNGYGFAASDYRSYASNKLLTGNPTEVFTSFSLKNPIGKKMPHSNEALADNTYSSASDLKTCWVFGLDSITNDVVTPTLVLSSFSVTGNDLQNLESNIGGASPSFFTFGEWCRFTTWMKAGAIPETDAGDFYFQGMSESGGQLQTSNNNAIFQGGTAPYEWKSINVTGWARETTAAATPTAADVQILYDDIYLAWGDNAAARVEIGNNANYGLCTKLSVCDPLKDSNGNTIWSDGQVTLNLRQSDLDFNSDVFLFVTGADNTQLVARQIL